MKLIFADPQIDVDDNLARSAQKFQGFEIVPKITGKGIKRDRKTPEFVGAHSAPMVPSFERHRLLCLSGL